MLAVLLWLGWEGGAIGDRVGGWLDALLGVAALLLPVVLVGLGGLMLVRSALVDLRPFRTGLAVACARPARHPRRQLTAAGSAGSPAERSPL